MTDGLRLAVINGTTMVWSGQRVSADGITIERQLGTIIFGQINDLAGGCEYSFDIKTKEFKAEWVYFRDAMNVDMVGMRKYENE